MMTQNSADEDLIKEAVNHYREGLRNSSGESLRDPIRWKIPRGTLFKSRERGFVKRNHEARTRSRWGGGPELFPPCG